MNTDEHVDTARAVASADETELPPDGAFLRTRHKMV